MNEKPEKNPGEVEVSDFIRLLGRIFTSIWNGIAWLFTNLFDLLILFFLFLKRKALWLGLALVIGLGYGIYCYYTEGKIYRSEMVTKSNFESNYFLHSQIEYFNSLIANGNLNELGTIFNLKESEAKDIEGFEITPVKSDIEAAKLYRQTFLQSKRNHNYRFDTIWSRTIKFDVFKKQLEDRDFPVNKIIVRSRQPNIFLKIQQGFLNSFNNNPELKERKEAHQQIRKQEEMLLTEALNNIDTLRKVYNRKISMQSETGPAGSNQLILGERDIRNPELDLYDKSMMIKDELMELKMKTSDEKEPLVLYSGLGNTGNAESPRRKVAMPALYLLAAVFSILVIIEFIKYLGAVEKTKKIQ